MRQIQILLLSLIIGGLVVSGPLAISSSAHASLLASSPANGQVVGGDLTRLELVFNETVEIATVEVSGPGENTLPITVSQPSANQLVVSFERALDVEGDYRLEYELISVDEDPISLVLRFSYDAEADPLVPFVANAVSVEDGFVVSWPMRIGLAGLLAVIAWFGGKLVRSQRKLRRLQKPR